MRIRSVAVFAVGYYLGARAGRHRYEQINRLLDRAIESDAGARARAMVDLGMERARDLLNLPNDGAPPTAPMPGPPIKE